MKADIYELQEDKGIIYLTNLTGQRLLEEKIYETGYHEFGIPVKERNIFHYSGLRWQKNSSKIHCKQMMRKKERSDSLKGNSYRKSILVIILLLCSLQSYAQEPPPRPLEVHTTAQELCFGAFSLAGAGGTVIIYANGSRGYGGNVVLLSVNPVYSTTRLDLIANPGTVVSLLSWPSSTLSDGTHTMSFQLDSSQPVLPLVITSTPPAATIT